MIPPAPIRRLLLQVIEGRRRAVAALIAGSPSAQETLPAGAAPAEAGPAGAGPADDEETLRRFMVVAWPAAGRMPQDDGVRSEFFGLLARLEAPALRDDLRFLDAWNNAFETMAAWPAAIGATDEMRTAFRTYARILDHQAARLGGTP
jgi:hypothetical protein